MLLSYGGYITSEDEQYYTVTFENPIEVEGIDEETILKATALQINAVERLIRQHLKQWF